MDRGLPPIEPRDLRSRALRAVARFQITLWLLLFLPAWSIHFWQAWLYWALLLAACLVMTLHMAARDPALLASRLAAGPAAEGERSQKILQGLASACAIALFTVPGIERRYNPSTIPLSAVLGADALVVLGLFIVSRVFRENSHASSVVEVKSGQRVISTGPYSIVRHPMYAASMLLLMATPAALGSLWAFACAAPLCLVIAARLLDEERYLAKRLPGYDEYRERVRHRLIPHVW